MSDQGKIEKIHKLDTKHKTASIIKLMEGKHSDAEVICAAPVSYTHLRAHET